MKTAISVSANAPLLLLAGDDLLLQSRIQSAAQASGFATVAAATTEAVNSLLRSPLQSPAAIVVNLSARRFDPFTLIRQLKGDPATAHLPILAFAGHVETDKHQQARECGADMVVANSSVAQHLSALLPRLLNQSSTTGRLESESEDDHAAASG